jgi:hypothetical protein
MMTTILWLKPETEMLQQINQIQTQKKCILQRISKDDQQIFKDFLFLISDNCYLAASTNFT